MGKGLNLAAAVLAGTLACAEGQEQEVIDQRPETVEVDPEINTCVVYAHERASEVCEKIFCGPYLFRDVQAEVQADCEQGIMPEPGSDVDTCDKEGLTKGARAYFHAGQIGYNFDGIRDAGYGKCLGEKDIAKNNLGQTVPKEPQIAVDNKLAQVDVPQVQERRIPEPLNLPDGLWSTSMIARQRELQRAGLDNGATLTPQAVENILQNRTGLNSLRSPDGAYCRTEAATKVDQFIEQCVNGVSGCTAREVTAVFENSFAECLRGTTQVPSLKIGE